jgi:poly-gamma-glutamate synthase PgsB/CapB
LACLATFFVYLVQERVRLERARRKIPLRIAVAGTRGKSGVTRLVAAGLRESGLKVLAKTTGSRPALIHPDGSEEEIPRAGNPSIREQIRMMGRAAAEGAEAVVAEMMSIGAECLLTESQRIIRPGILALTNVRLDHLEAMGCSRPEIARTLAAAIPERARVFFPAEEFHPVFEETASRLRTGVVAVSDKIGVEDLRLPFEEFEPNTRLALGVLESLGIGREAALQGMDRAAPDFGSLRIWRAQFGSPPRQAVCASAFAANDPESSAAVVARIREIIPPTSKSLVGLLSLREDRGDRTLQWIRSAGDGFFRDFENVAVLGSPAFAAGQRLKKIMGPDFRKFSFFAHPKPAELMDLVTASAAHEPVVIGLGNIVGHGERLVRYWDEIGRPYGH